MHGESESNAPPLSVPDRFESLSRRASVEQLSTIVEPIEEGLRGIDRRYAQMKSSHRGSFWIIRGQSGAGKSTFLHTVGQFRKGVTTVSVPGAVDIRKFFSEAEANHPLKIFVLEEREAAATFSDRELEDWLHAINGFIRTSRGEAALVVWPCNTNELADRVTRLADAIGSDTLLPSPRTHSWFNGPQKEQFRKIAQTTIAVLNQGASFADLGVSESKIDQIVSDSQTIGGFLGRVRDSIQEQEQYVQELLPQEQARLWVIVAAGNEPSQEVAALTRGRYAAVDIERLMTATEANIVQELKKQPEKLGILATILDARILHLPVLSTLDLVRAFASDFLKARMRGANLSLKPDNKDDAIARLKNTELARIFEARSQSTLATGKKPGSLSVEAFSKLADIASSNDIMLNRAVGTALRESGLLTDFALEGNFGKGLSRRTDIVANVNGSGIRLEMMWRRRTSRAEIANYTLTKLANYGRALGYLN